MSERQNRLKEQGYTDKQIKNYLSYKAYEQKKVRERRKRNNEKNIELIKQIKKDLLKKTFENKFKKTFVENISPTVDGKGFWIKKLVKFSDGSEGYFRDFVFFDEYNLDKVIDNFNF